MYVGNDLTKLDQFGVDLLTNREVVAVNQAGTPAQPVSTSTDKQVWYAPNADGSYTVALFNLGRTDSDITANWSDLGLIGAATVRDLWAGKDLGTFASKFTGQTIPIHGVRLLRVTPQKGATVALNDDAQRVAYKGGWTRNGGNEVPATTQPLQVAVGNSSTGQVPTPPASGRIVSVNDDDPGIAYSGSWGQSRGRGFGDYKDDVHYVEGNGSSVQYTFTGTGIDYVTELDESQGDVDVYLDGEFQKTVGTARGPGDPRSRWCAAVGPAERKPHAPQREEVGTVHAGGQAGRPQESLLHRDAAVFDKSAQADVSTEIGRDPGELVSIANAGKILVKGTDYTVEGKVVTIKKEYLAAQPVSSTVLDFSFRGDYRDDVHSATANGAAITFAFRGHRRRLDHGAGSGSGRRRRLPRRQAVRRVNLSNEARVTTRQVFSQTGDGMGSTLCAS